MAELTISMGKHKGGSVKLNKFGRALPSNIKIGLQSAGDILLKSMSQKISGPGFTYSHARSSPYPGIGYRRTKGGKGSFSGRMRESLFTKLIDGGKGVRVGPNVKYAIYHEMGTSKMPARPFVWPTWEDTGDKAIDVLQKIIMRPL